MDHGRAVQGHDRDRNSVAIGTATHYLIGFGPLAGAELFGAELFYCGITGLVVTALIIVITEYYTAPIIGGALDRSGLRDRTWH